uniref:Uncharacterized protein n=1 Tax=Arundo donax TaxID=35708 RepID=A0A0A9FH68_ARUDO
MIGSLVLMGEQQVEPTTDGRGGHHPGRNREGQGQQRPHLPGERRGEGGGEEPHGEPRPAPCCGPRRR